MQSLPRGRHTLSVKVEEVEKWKKWKKWKKYRARRLSKGLNLVCDEGAAFLGEQDQVGDG